MGFLVNEPDVPEFVVDVPQPPPAPEKTAQIISPAVPGLGIKTNTLDALGLPIIGLGLPDF